MVGYFHVWEIVPDGQRVRRKKEKTLGPATKPKQEALNDLAEHIAEHTGKLAKPAESLSTFAELGNANQLRNAFSVFLIAVLLLVGQKRTTSCLHPPPSTAFRSAHT
jgi:hypothetical protein